MAKYNYPKIVVTGIGAVTPIGNNIKDFWQNAKDGMSGAGPITRFDASEFKTKFACELKDYDPLKHISKKDVQRMDLFAQFAISASAEAIENANLDLETLDLERIGVIIGSGIGGMSSYHTQQQNLFKRDGKPDRISPFFVPMIIGDIAAGQVAIKYGLKGPNYATISACASSTHSICDAMMLLQRGSADVILAGGSEATITPMGVGGFNAMKALSQNNENMKTASRPFDKTRDGFVMGEGSAVLVMETEEHALARGANILAEVAGFGMTDDGFHITQPAPGGEGAVRSMKIAIADAGLKPEDVDYINAHGTSTPANDKNESLAIKTVFGDHAYKLSVSSTKSMTGHLLGAAGALEAAVAIMAIRENIIPPTINYKTPDEGLDLDYTPNKAKEKEVNVAMSNTFGFGGHNATVVFKSY